jgi:hypothetical protein
MIVIVMLRLMIFMDVLLDQEIDILVFGDF